MILTSYPRESGYFIISEGVIKYPIKSEGLEHIDITERGEEAVMVYSNQELQEARLGKKRYDCWEVTSSGRRYDRTRSHWCHSDEQAIYFFRTKYKDQAILIQKNFVSIWQGEAIKNEPEQTFVQMTLFGG